MAKKYLDNDGLLYLWQKIHNGFVLKETGKGLSTNDFTDAYKSKLDGIEDGANKTIVDSAISSTSTNPVQNLVIYNALNNKVDKVSGKGLSSNDLTDDLKAKYDTAVQKVDELTETGGAPNVIEIVKVNGTPLTPDSNKAVNVVVPTKTSDLTNDDNTVKDADYVHTDNNYTDTDKDKLAGIDAGANKTIVVDNLTSTSATSALSAAQGKALNDKITTINNAGYQTAAQVNSIIGGKGYQTESQVNTLIANAVADIQGISYQVVTSLPSTGEAGVIYLISNSGSNPNSYDEYIYVNNKFEKIGTTDVDLSGYVQDSDLVAITNAEIDTIISSVN